MAKYPKYIPNNFTILRKASVKDKKIIVLIKSITFSLWYKLYNFLKVPLPKTHIGSGQTGNKPTYPKEIIKQQISQRIIYIK